MRFLFFGLLFTCLLFTSIKTTRSYMLYVQSAKAKACSLARETDKLNTSATLTLNAKHILPTQCIGEPQALTS